MLIISQTPHILIESGNFVMLIYVENQNQNLNI